MSTVEERDSRKGARSWVEVLDRKVERPASRATRVFLLCAVFAAGFLTVALLPPVPIWPGYNLFADRRTLLGIPNALDVLSNVPFVVVGITGLVFLSRGVHRRNFRKGRERIPYFILFAGVTLTGLGSFYYHLAPGNERLPWDLLPMTSCYASLVAAMIMERVSERAGLVLLAPLMVAGIGSVLYWRAGQLLGHGDLRFYLFAQFFSAVAIGATVLLFPPTYTGTSCLGVAFGLYVLAKVTEALDKPIYSMGRIVSGHTLKHLLAALAGYWLLRMLEVRHSLVSAPVQPQMMQGSLNRSESQSSVPPEVMI